MELYEIDGALYRRGQDGVLRCIGMVPQFTVLDLGIDGCRPVAYVAAPVVESGLSRAARVVDDLGSARPSDSVDGEGCSKSLR